MLKQIDRYSSPRVSLSSFAELVEAQPELIPPEYIASHHSDLRQNPNHTTDNRLVVVSVAEPRALGVEHVTHANVRAQAHGGDDRVESQNRAGVCGSGTGVNVGPTGLSLRLPLPEISIHERVVHEERFRIC